MKRVEKNMKKFKMMVIVACVCAPVMVVIPDASARQSDFDDLSITSTDSSNIVMSPLGIVESGFDLSSPGTAGKTKLATLDISTEGMLSHNTPLVSSHMLRETEQSFSFQLTGIGTVVPDRSVLTSMLPAFCGLMILGFVGLLAMRRPMGSAL